jgi:putative salt-induced outer membrane protein YdiY
VSDNQSTFFLIFILDSFSGGAVAKIFGLIALIIFFNLLVFADQVTLKNGDRLTGTILKSDGKTLVVQTDYAGELSLKWEAVQAIDSKENLHLQLQNGQTVAGPVTGSDGKLQVSTPRGAVEASISDVKALRSDAEETAYENSLHPGLFQEWKSGLNLGFALTRGNSETKNLSIGFVATRQTLHDKLGAYANSVYSSNDAPGAVPSTTANTAGGGFRYDHDLRKRLFAFVAADFFSDALQGLNIRAVEGGGLGFHAIKNDRTALDFLGGANYTHESYTAFTRNFAALTIGESWTQKLGKSTALLQDLNFFPDLNDMGEYRATFDFGTVTKLTHRLGWQNSFSDIYVTNPPAGKRKNDLVLTTGLNVSFGE